MTTTCSTPVAGAPAATPAAAPRQPQGAQTAGKPVLTPSRLYRGVLRVPDGHWMAYLAHGAGKRQSIGCFRSEVAAALAHDRVAIAHAGPQPGLNLPWAFHRLEVAFLRRCGKDDVLSRVRDGTFEPKYAAFLTHVYQSNSKDFFNDLMNFFIDRRHEVGTAALLAGGETLWNRFMQMHWNRATLELGADAAAAGVEV